MNNELEISVQFFKEFHLNKRPAFQKGFCLRSQTAETVEAIVTQLMEKQRAARTAALNKQLECGCPDSTGPDKCGHQTPTITASSGGRKVTKSEAHTTSGSNSGRAPSSRTHGGHRGRGANSLLMRMHPENNNQVRPQCCVTTLTSKFSPPNFDTVFFFLSSLV